MRLTSLVTFAALAAIWFALPAQGQNVGFANPSKIFNDMQETKDLKAKLDADAKGLQDQDAAKQAALKDLQAKRDNFKPGTQPYDDANKVLLENAIQFRAWREMMQQDQQRIQKQNIRSLYDKIAAAAGKVGPAHGMNVVISQGPDLPQTLDSITLEQLQLNINQRNVLWADPKLDLTVEITTTLDAEYKATAPPPAPAAGGTTPPAPAPGGPTPAPTPAPAPNP